MNDDGEKAATAAPQVTFGPAELGALAHLYRGEMYQSKIWRARLDTTTNWAVVTTGIALSVTFSQADASPLPMLLVSWVLIAFLAFEARRYVYYDIFRMRVRVMEVNFYAPMLAGRGIRTDNQWNELLANDYRELRFHITYWEALGRRLRRNYAWLFIIQLACYAGKIIVHPTPLHDLNELWARAAIGPVPGEVALALGVAFHLSWAVIAVVTLRSQRSVGLPKRRSDSDLLAKVAAGY
ncbi:MAG TPA: DUF2270 domain-containing protein [Rhodospirillales bacterium]|nr:DUF2270 domain-containing protein [Rhodospirillales bacterium]